MIWFDAALESPADDDLLQRSIATVLNTPSETVDIVHSISEIKDVLATCVVDAPSADSYSQRVTLYIHEPLPSSDVAESASQLARALGTSLLLVNDATANPYSFVHVSGTGQCSVVFVDSDELDENGRYIIQDPR
ncbi:hypothetical protein N8D56_27365 (plasmid) [Devosia sp. A8/3-2]|nr:hypothetical protein N8D56_27365 [Devosia sp. A8/3-2]